jgi:hypothetical protein
MKFDELDIYSVGSALQYAGVVFQSEDQTLIAVFPDEDFDGSFEQLEMDRDQWTKFLRQTDLMETEILAKAPDGKLMKTVIRKSARQIDTRVRWAVYRRDEFKCRYCGNDQVPLTVDHLVLWEEGGPSTEDNLVACCKKCNRNRANKQLAHWFECKRYKNVSRNLEPHVIELNRALLDILPNIPRRVHEVSR